MVATRRFFVGPDGAQSEDAPVDKAAWATYRRAVSDLPENTINLEDAVWPKPPE